MNDSYPGHARSGSPPHAAPPASPKGRHYGDFGVPTTRKWLNIPYLAVSAGSESRPNPGDGSVGIFVLIVSILRLYSLIKAWRPLQKNEADWCPTIGAVPKV
jgi:hypothetical protein